MSELTAVMSPPPRIYLDNAATSYPKPEAVYQAMDDYHRRLGAAVGRGGYRQALEVQGVVDRCRKQAAALLGAESPERIIFTFNGTDSLNLAIRGLLGPGDHVIASAVEHNSVLRPLRDLQTRLGVEVTILPADDTGLVDLEALRPALRRHTKLVILTHASNVTGTIQPIAEAGRLAREAGALFLVDAAQTAGHLPIDLKQLPIDLLACPGHKGLLGPLGTGLLYLRPGVERQFPSLRQGGTGTHSEDDRQPEALPDKYESGNHNAPGLFGLAAALAFLQEQGIDSVRAHEQACLERLRVGLADLPGASIYGPRDLSAQVGVMSLASEAYEPQILAAILDENFQVQTRAGLHCAPGAHRALGTFASGGTVRLSVGPFTAFADIDAALAALGAILTA